MKSTVHHRKPSTINYDSPFLSLKTDVESRIRAVFGKRGIVYLATTLLVVLLITFTSVWSKGDSSNEGIDNSLPEPMPEIMPALHGVFDSVSEPERPPLQDELIIPERGQGGRDRPTTAERPGKGTSSQTSYGFPIVSTRNRGSVVMLTGATGPGHFLEIEAFYPLIVENRMDYANAHGYDFMTVDLSAYVITHKSHPVWGKLPAILEAFKKYPSAEWVWWLDVDAVIMTPEVDLYEHLLAPSVLQRTLTEGDPILVLNDQFVAVNSGLRTQSPDQVDLIISQDHSGPNAGSFFIRNTAMMKLFIDMWSDPLITERTPTWSQREQDALTYLILNHPFLLERVGFVPQRLINSYAKEPNMWQPGDVVVHFAGCWVDSECVTWFNRFWGRRGRLTPSESLGQ